MRTQCSRSGEVKTCIVSRGLGRGGCRGARSSMPLTALRGENPDVDFEGRMELTQGKAAAVCSVSWANSDAIKPGGHGAPRSVPTASQSVCVGRMGRRGAQSDGCCTLIYRYGADGDSPLPRCVKQSGNPAPRRSRATAWVGLGIKQDDLPSRASRLSIKICVDRYGYVLLLFR